MKSSFPIPDSFPAGTTFFHTLGGDTFVYFPDDTCALLTLAGGLVPCMSVRRTGDEISEEVFRRVAAP